MDTTANAQNLIGEQKNLSREQREAIGLLSVGTFLEYFDVMLYIHMAVLLNELFFPKTDPFVTSLLAAATFCSTYVFRPLGALIFGYIGDTFGRKTTVLLTMFIMAGCCTIMALLPTYAEIGLTASCIMILCRIVQGMAAMGESIGAEIYVTETVKPPMQYPMVALVALVSGVGGAFALGIASLVTGFGGNWRIAFWIGAVVAVVGMVARTTLRETSDFADAKRSMQNIVKQTRRDQKILENSAIWTEKVNTITALSFFAIQCVCPLGFYIAYIYCGTILQDKFGFTAGQVIHHNFLVSLILPIIWSFLAYLSYKIYPLKILRVNFVIIAILFLASPYLLTNITVPFQLGIFQVLLGAFSYAEFPANPIFYKHFPVFKRFTASCLTYALGRAVMFAITSFGLIYLIQYFGNWGILFIAIPTLIAYKFSLTHFEKLNQQEMKL